MVCKKKISTSLDPFFGRILEDLNVTCAISSLLALQVPSLGLVNIDGTR